jgi:hypothetical protein
MDHDTEWRLTMAARSMRATAVVKRMTKDLPAEFDDLVSSALMLASIIDSPDARDQDRLRADVQLRDVLAGISARIADSVKRSESWSSRTLRTA